MYPCVTFGLPAPQYLEFRGSNPALGECDILRFCPKIIQRVLERVLERARDVGRVTMCFRGIVKISHRK